MDIPQFDFNAAIPGPKEMGVSNKGRLSQISKNAGAVSGYVDLIMSGTPTAFTKNTMSKRARSQVRPLGSRFFVDGIRKCKYQNPETQQEEEVSMSEYIDMVPRGTALGPVVSRKLRESGFDTRGLVPGVLEDIMAINPGSIFDSAKNKNNARCIRVRGLVNKKQDDGSLDPTAKQPDLRYLPEGVDWNHMNTLCNNPPKGMECVSKYVQSNQSQPMPLPEKPVTRESFMNPVSVPSNVVDRLPYQSMIIGVLLLLLIFFIYINKK